MKFRLALPEDWDRLSDYDDRGHGYGFPTVLAERNGEIVGLMSSSMKREDVIECTGIKADSPIITLRLMEAYESVLSTFDVKGYIFTIAKDDDWFIDEVLRLPDTEQYGEAANHIFVKRIIHGRQRLSPTPNSH